MDKIRVLIVDDHAIVRMGMASLVNTQPNMGPSARPRTASSASGPR